MKLLQFIRQKYYSFFSVNIILQNVNNEKKICTMNNSNPNVYCSH